ncbi:MAG: helix-turn-helix domain-containing protein [Anaerolinea sp.]|nr:helix-turn-helix domain-containing protein [Anaerolinea sp.]
MTPQRAQITVFELLRYVLPMGTRVVAGAKGLHKIVSWTSVLHPRPPAFPSLEGRELALLSIDALRLLSDKLTLADLINDLAQMDVSAVGVIGGIDQRARAAADTHAIPLLNLPSGTQTRQIERDVVRALVGPLPTAEARGAEIHQQLLQLTTENQGMRALVGALADSCGYTVVVQDKRFDVLASAGVLTGLGEWAQIESALSSEDPLPALFRNRVEVAQTQPEPAEIVLPELNLKRLIMPIIANRMGRGFISLITSAEDESSGFDALDLQFIKHSAAICALEMAKEKAIREAQKRVQGGVLERLLLGTIPPDQATRQLVRLGHEPNGRLYAAISAAWLDNESPSDRRLETIFNEEVNSRDYEAVVQLLDGGVVAFCAVEVQQSAHRAIPRSVKGLADAVLARIGVQTPGKHVGIGVGRPVGTLAEWRGSYQEALAAQRIASQWRVDQPLYFADLGVYRLLSLLLETPELNSFHRETLGDLLDSSNVSDEFILTLETFFEEHGNLSQTANRLHVHRNTLLYRMERIEQIGGFDLNNPETRLAVHLALKIRRLLASSK